MNEEEKATYHAEISRLNKIISIVIEQNDLLKQENQHLKIFLGQKVQNLPDFKTGLGQTENSMPNVKTYLG